ncbi:MAG: ABC transporter ATP-binding protein [Oscillospiraceae bacterium]|jgi:ABC-2 type transport system ATP-binding protein|nr:ABC transporter ATP-binding protein [Oscillospiraceae bacterium]
MIEVKNVVKTFEGFTALNKLSLHVPQGAIYGLVGPNGAGKSTIIRHITGIFRQDEGEVLVNGQPVFENPAVKKDIAYIPDDVFFFTQATLRDMMKFYKGVCPGFSTERFEKLRQAFDLNENAKMRSLSKGMQKQAAFRLTVSMCPRVLVLDEPVDGLDPVMRRQVWSILMADVAENGTTVLVSSHNLRELEDVCDHVGIMHRGRLLLERRLSDLQDNIAKVQLALPDGEELPEDLQVLHRGSTGRLQTIIVRGSREEITNKLATREPLFMDVIPLTLEEIFIYELGGEHYEIKDIIL